MFAMAGKDEEGHYVALPDTAGAWVVTARKMRALQ